MNLRVQGEAKSGVRIISDKWNKGYWVVANYFLIIAKPNCGGTSYMAAHPMTRYEQESSQ